MRLSEYIEQAWVITCSRCKYEGMSWTEDIEFAEIEFAERGWTLEEVQGTFFTGTAEIHHGLVRKIFCPQCNGKPRQV